MRSSFTASELIEGREYRIVREFRDFDGVVHRVGEQWIFRSKNFLPYDDGLSLFVEIDGKELHIRLQWRHGAQLEIIEDFQEYAEELNKGEQSVSPKSDRAGG